jgi:F-type H+-transporting ATPase subunit delta
VRQTILARRYAKALFAVGKENGKNEEYGQGLQELAELFAQVPEMSDGLTNPLYPLDVRVKVMEHLIEATRPDAMMGNFLILLVQKKRANVLPEIAEEFQELMDSDSNISRGTVVSAIVLSEELLGKIRQALEKITGNKVILASQVDPSIIGGIIAKVGDLVLDGSIKTQLADLQESITGSE